MIATATDTTSTAAGPGLTKTRRARGHYTTADVQVGDEWKHRRDPAGKTVRVLDVARDVAAPEQSRAMVKDTTTGRTTKPLLVTLIDDYDRVKQATPASPPEAEAAPAAPAALPVAVVSEVRESRDGRCGAVTRIVVKESVVHGLVCVVPIFPSAVHAAGWYVALPAAVVAELWPAVIGTERTMATTTPHVSDSSTVPDFEAMAAAMLGQGQAEPAATQEPAPPAPADAPVTQGDIFAGLRPHTSAREPGAAVDAPYPIVVGGFRAGIAGVAPRIRVIHLHPHALAAGGLYTIEYPGPDGTLRTEGKTTAALLAGWPKAHADQTQGDGAWAASSATVDEQSTVHVGDDSPSEQDKNLLDIAVGAYVRGRYGVTTLAIIDTFAKGHVGPDDKVIRASARQVMWALEYLQNMGGVHAKVIDGLTHWLGGAAPKPVVPTLDDLVTMLPDDCRKTLTIRAGLANDGQALLGLPRTVQPANALLAIIRDHAIIGSAD